MYAFDANLLFARKQIQAVNKKVLANASEVTFDYREYIGMLSNGLGGVIIQNSKYSRIAPASFSSFIMAILKGVSQVLLIENAISGLIIVAAIMIADISLGMITIAASVIGTWVGLALGQDRNAVHQGLFGYNSVLTAIALFIFLDGMERWGIALIGAALAALVTAAVMHVMSPSKLPILTLPYVILTWFLLLASFQLKAFKLNSSEALPESQVYWVEAFFNGIGQVYLQEGLWTGLLILVAIFWASRRIGVYVVVGAIAALLAAYALGAEVNALNLGLYGYNAVLTIIAVSVVFHTQGNKMLTGIIAAICTVPVAAGLGALLMPYGISPLSMPFILVTWLFIAARSKCGFIIKIDHFE